MTAKLEYRKGDLFAALDKHLNEQPSRAYPGFIMVPHVCNDQGAWGAGFVLALSKWWPEAEAQYRRWSKAWKPTIFRMGMTALVENVQGVYIANMVAQELGGVKPLRYAALGSCMFQAAEKMNAIRFYGEHDPTNTVAVDYTFKIWCPKFGSGLAGGNWSHIEEMIVETWVETFGCDVTVFER